MNQPCQYCGKSIPPEAIEHGRAHGKPAKYCHPNHRTLQKQRRRRLEARGIAGPALAALLREPANIKTTKTERARRAAIRKRPLPLPLPPIQRKDGLPNYVDVLRTLKGQHPQ